MVFEFKASFSYYSHYHEQEHCTRGWEWFIVFLPLWAPPIIIRWPAGFLRSYTIAKTGPLNALSCSGVCTRLPLCQPVNGDVLKCYIVEIELYIVFGELQTLQHWCICGCQLCCSHLPHPNSPWNKALKDEERLELLFQCGSHRNFHSIMPFTLRACLTKSRSNSIQAR